jgi:small subunit ribosomal protein S26e
MTVKRRNHGRNRPAHSRGHVKFVRCDSTGKAIGKDKAVKRFMVRNIVDASSMRDILEQSTIEGYQLPKLYVKMHYCIEAAIHQRIVRGRSSADRRIRTPPPQGREGQEEVSNMRQPGKCS